MKAGDIAGGIHREFPESTVTFALFLLVSKKLRAFFIQWRRFRPTSTHNCVCVIARTRTSAE